MFNGNKKDGLPFEFDLQIPVNEVLVAVNYTVDMDMKLQYDM